MPYTHDIFISYKRDQFKDSWLNESFVPMFMYYVHEQIAATCGRPTQGIFFDQTAVSNDQRRLDAKGLEPGDDWRNALRRAIKTSRCVVCLWSPLYFYSEWCKVEWSSFHQRALNTGRRLVVPMSVHDGLSFPDAAQALQAPDFSSFVRIGDGFKKTEAYQVFQERMQAFAITVAECVHNAPEFDDFPLAEAGPAPASVEPPGGLQLGPDVPQQRLS